MQRREFFETMACASLAMAAPPVTREVVFLALDPEDFPTITGAEQRLEPGEKHPENPILAPRPGHWDGTRCKVYGTVLFDSRDRLFKMWYSGTTDTPDAVRRRDGSPRHIGYAYSEDGVRWTRPELGLIEFQGSRANNLIELNAQAPNVFLRPEESDPKRRFLMITETGMNTFNNKILYSDDGIHWTRSNEQPIASIQGGKPGESFAAHAAAGRRIHEPFSILHDPLDPNPARRWKGYSLLHDRRNGYRGRSVGLFLGPNPEQWVEYETQPIMSASDGMESEIHLPHVSRMHDTYVMLYDAMEPNHHTETEVAVSHDGIRFRRVQNGVKLLPNGSPGEPDAGKVCVSPRSMFVHEGRIWWYYTISADTYQTGPRGLRANPWYRYTALARWREQGFASLRLASGAARASVFTRQWKSSQGQVNIWLNAVTRGEEEAITLELLDRAGKTLARSRPWRGDELRGKIQWQGRTPVVKAGEFLSARLSWNSLSTRVYAMGIRGQEAPRPVEHAPQDLRSDSRRRWVFRAKAKLGATPVLLGDLVLVTSWDQSLYALDRKNGTVVWKFGTGNAITTTPATSGGRVYTASRDGYVYCVDARTGGMQWKVLVSAGRTAASTNGPWIDCPPVIGAYTCGPAPGDPPLNHLFVGCHNRTLHALRLEDGSEEWRFPAFNWILGRPAVENYRVYFGSLDGRIYAVDARCGAAWWMYVVGRHLKYSPKVVPGSIASEGVAGAPLVADETVYCGADDGFLYALDARTGAEKWAFQTEKWIWGRPLLAGGVLIAGSADGRVCGLEAQSGKRVWTRALENAVYADVVGAGDLALVACTSGKLYALSTQTGEFKWTYDAGSGLRAAPAVSSDGVIYLAACDGSLHAIAV